ncbi:hypothetical protein [Microbacterium sp. 3J1]|uniref:hypothetical protein n=1 Tax=Microbacterium sp. 3J1 TaxID=861269 RepID=UPI000A6293A9|nr:hypothetical protein [Microbacterium sp. 3J1]
MKNTLLGIVATALLLLGTGAPAQASERGLHPDVRYALEAVPSGVIVDDTTVVWPELDMTLTVASSTGRSVGSCATGTYCAYSGSNRSGTKLAFGVCTVVSTSALAVVGSIANARPSGNVQARTSAGTILATAGAGTGVNVATGTASLRCNL